MGGTCRANGAAVILPQDILLCSASLPKKRAILTTSHAKSSLAALSIGAVGIVYGDIGTSPLYTLKTVFSPEHGLAMNQANLLGIISMILWGLTIVVSLKYVTLILRADNRGEGGIMALMALALNSVTKQSKAYFPLMLMGVFGATLFYGDSVITPAISVLSAMEGMEVATPAAKPFILPMTVVILVGLYMVQAHGTAGIARWFGPIMLLWFGVLAVMGLINILRAPQILAAFNPWNAVNFLIHNPKHGFIALGAVVLALTGAEALYADLGHFGKTPMRVSWFSVVFPALALNYLGQGALLIVDPAAITHPFYHQLGSWSVIPLVILSGVATVIASQATISGTFSITKEAIALGFLPRMRIIHTSAQQMGQIYIPIVNWMQLAAVLMAVVGFGNSDNLAAAYGIAVTLTMVVTTVMTFFVVRYRWHYSAFIAFAATGGFLFVDLALFSSTALKLISGGWFPLTLGAVLCAIMLTWKRGRALVYNNLAKHAIPLEDFLQSLFVDPPTRVYGTAIFMRADNDGVPHVLLHNLIHNKVLHERVVFLTVHNVDDPYVLSKDQIKVTDLGHHCYQLDVYYGFKDEPDLPQVLDLAKDFGLEFEMMETSFFIARQTIISRPGSGMAPWREHMFIAMFRNARDAADYYQIPPNRVIELGTQVEI
jgi:KUP system potassium uptake protein